MPGTFNYSAPASTFDYEGFASTSGSTRAPSGTGDTNVLSATTWTTIQTNYINQGTSWANLPTAVGMNKAVLRTALLLKYLQKYRNYDTNSLPIRTHRARNGG